MKNKHKFQTKNIKNTRLTNRKMQDKRFRRTEQAIYVAYFQLRGSPSVEAITHYARISRSTLYRHHKTIRDIPKDYEKYLLDQYVSREYLLTPCDTNLKITFLRALIFIATRDRVFKTLFENDYKKFVKTISCRLRPRIISEWQLSGNLDRLFYVYQNEVLGVLEFWSEQDFSRQYLNRTLDNILYLTKTAPSRLAFLIE